MKSVLAWVGIVTGVLFLLVVVNRISNRLGPLPEGVAGITHIDSATDYVFRTTPSDIGGACQGWNVISVQRPGQDSTGITNLLCWQERDGMLHTATAEAESPDVFPMKGIASPTPTKVARLAPNTSIFDAIQLGAPFNLSGCHGDDEKACIVRSEPGTREWRVRIPALNDSDRYSSVVNVMVLEGSAHGATVRTFEGRAAQTNVLDDLVAKYGQPTTLSVEKGYATWDFDNLNVMWLIPESRPQSAAVVFRTPEGKRAEKADRDLKEALEPKL